MEQELQQIDHYIEEHLGRALEELALLVRHASVSTQNEDLPETAALVAELLDERDFTAEVMENGDYPVVYAAAPGTSDRTMILYNHYDVQPAEPLGLWDSPAFELSQRDGKLYGRGVADDKGHIISRLAAIDAVRAALGALPCRMKFLIEGGEECGSPHLPEFVARHRDLLSADTCVWETGGVDFDGRPQLTLGMRGICYVQYNVRTMSRDAHSGSAHILPNAAWRLVRALNSIKDTEEHILIPGFYDDVQPVSEEDMQLLEQLEPHEDRLRQSYGIAHFNRNMTGTELAKAVFSPTANVCGLSSGYEGAGMKTVIPGEAMAKMDFRLVPDQDPVDIVQKLRAYLQQQGYDDIEVVYLGGERAAKTPVNDPFVQLTAQTARDVYGVPPRITPLTGGSGPMHAFREYLEVPIVTVGVGYPETLIHAPNENIRIEDFVRGTKHMGHLLARYGSADQRGETRLTY